jgi:hypothetical protein
MQHYVAHAVVFSVATSYLSTYTVGPRAITQLIQEQLPCGLIAAVDLLTFAVKCVEI